MSTWIIPAFIAGFRSSPRNWKRLSKKEETPPSVYRWVQKFTLQLEAAFQKGRKHPVGTSWRMDETYIQVKGQWKYLYRAVDQEGQPIDFLLTAHRDQQAARRFFKKAIGQHGLPATVTIDQSGANTAALDALKEEMGAAIEVRQINSS